MIYILITADYELYFGKNFLSYDEVLFEPAKRIMNALKGRNIPLNIFPDICSIWRYRDYNLLDYADKFESELVEAIQSGHDVQMHIHPHWLKSKYDGNTWIHDLNTFKLQDWGFEDENVDQCTANSIIKKGIEYLETLLKKYVSDYQCIAFRAGGFCMQPKENELIKALIDSGIKIDSSIIPDLLLKTNVNNINFRGVPDLPNWFISPEYGIKTATNKGLFELPIPSSTKFIPKLEAMLRKITDKDVQGFYAPRGLVIQKISQQKETFIGKNVNRLNYLTKAVSVLEVDRMSSHRGMVYMFTILKDWIENYAHFGDIFISIIMHPKAIFQNHIDNLFRFIDSAYAMYPDIQITTFLEVYKILCQQTKDQSKDV